VNVSVKPSPAVASRLYETMVASRQLDLFINDRVDAGDTAPNFHSGIGQEALSVGAVLPLREQDYLLYTHRGYAQLLARGWSWR